MASAIDIIKNQRLTLLSPDSWDDRNDAIVLDRYRVVQKLECIKALCFTQAGKTYHHWRIFTENSDGVCLEFDKVKLIERLKKNDHLRWGKVNYLSIKKMLKNDIEIENVPFTKRAPYKDEKEFRIIYEGRNSCVDHVYVPVQTTCLRSITISPWLPRSLSIVIKEVLEDLLRDKNIKVLHSTLVDNKKWQLGMKI